jgi:cell division protein FtsQ
MRSLTNIKQKSRFNKPRRGWRINPWKIAGVAAIAAPWLVMSILLGGTGWVIFSKARPDSIATAIKSEVMLATLKLGFEIDAVWVDGLNRSVKEDVLVAVGANRGEPILDFDTAIARERLKKLPWIKEARVSLALPNQINVFLTERKPFAIWQINRELHVIDQDGEIIKGILAAEFAGLPTMVGKGANKAADSLFSLVAKTPNIANLMTAASFVGERRWDIRLDDRIDVQLPAEAAEEALLRLNKLQLDYQIFNKDILGIDLRVHDRLIVRVSDKKKSKSNNGSIKISAERRS